MGLVVLFMFIQNKTADMTRNTIVFVDDTKIKENILTEEDFMNVQENLDRLSSILWFWHLFKHHFSIMRPKSKHHEKPMIPKLWQHWFLMMLTFGSHDAKMLI